MSVPNIVKWDIRPRIKTIRAGNPDILLDEEIDVLEDIEDGAKLILWNDDVNTFQWVIESLMELVNHTFEQAEQCALIVHNNGKCQVKRGTFKEMCTYKDGFIDRGINATVE